MGPLSGMRVIDLADEKGELCGRVLADLGADVVRVEPPGGAVSRTLPPFAPDGETSLYFAFRNAGKRGATLDLDDAADRTQLERWLDDADVLVESFAPGRLDALELGPDALVERHPHLVVTSISDFGQTGPYRDWSGTDLVGFAMGGMMHRAGIPEKPPLVAPGALAYDAAGMTAALATLVGFWKRLATGRGQHLDVSVMEAVANLPDWAMPNFSINPNPGGRMGAGIYPLYRCADGYVRLIVLVKHHWHALLDWMGRPPELADPELDGFIQRLMRMAEIVPVIERFLADWPMVAAAEEAQRRGIACTPVLRPGEVLDNVHTRSRGTFRTLPIGAGREASLASGFFVVDGERAGPGSAPPERGAAFDGFAPAGPERRALLSGEKPAQTHARPLAGVRVLDFGIGAVGVEVGRLLAEQGADVLKVESARAPDFIRTILSTWMNANFASSSRSKKSLGVNLKDPRGLELVKRLLADVDVLIDNSATGVMERLGLDWETVHEINPRLVVFTSQLVGSFGPWKDWVGYGPSTHPVSGLTHLWNYPEDEERPAGSTATYPDHYVGRVGALGVLAGLVARQRSGRGLVADAAQFETSVGMLGDLFAAESLAPGSVAPQGNASPRGAPWGCYPCEGDDAWCVVCVRDDAAWRALRAVLGDPAWARDAALDTRAGRVAQRAQLDAELAAWTAKRPAREVMETLQAAGVAAGIVAHGGDHLGDPHLEARGFHQWIDQPGIGRLALEGTPFRGSDLPAPLVTPAPWLGEHTREVARERLGLSDSEIERLVADGVLEDPPDAPPSNQ